MSWCSYLSLSSKSRGCRGFWPVFLSWLLYSYCQESSFWCWTGGGAGSDGRAVFFTGAVGLGLDEDPDGAAGALAKRPAFYLGSEDSCNLW